MTDEKTILPDGTEARVVRPGEATDLPSVLAAGEEAEAANRARAAEGREGGTIPIVEEVARVEKRVVDKGTVRVATDVETVTERVETALRQQSATLDRVRVDRVVDAPPEPRLEGDTIVVPIIEERVVVTKQLVVTEEVRVKLDEVTHTDVQDVALRKERLHIDRIPAADAAAERPAPLAGDAPAHPER